MPSSNSSYLPSPTCIAPQPLSLRINVSGNPYCCVWPVWTVVFKGVRGSSRFSVQGVEGVRDSSFYT